MWPLLFCQKYSIILYKTFVTQFIIFHWTNWENMWDTKLYDWRHVNTSFTSYKHKINLHKWSCRFSRFKKNCDIQKFENGLDYQQRDTFLPPTFSNTSFFVFIFFVFVINYKVKKSRSMVFKYLHHLPNPVFHGCFYTSR